MKQRHPEVIDRAWLREQPITLNGQPAYIAINGSDFPRIVQRDTGLGAEWAWETIHHVVTNKGGVFKS